MLGTSLQAIHKHCTDETTRVQQQEDEWEANMQELIKAKQAEVASLQVLAEPDVDLNVQSEIGRIEEAFSSFVTRFQSKRIRPSAVEQ